jgi:hypothetical protein
MKKILFIALCISTFIFINCHPQRSFPLTTQKSDNNPTYEVEYLFIHDGCKVYRFYDKGSYVYFTSCNGETTGVTTDSTGTKYIKSKNIKQ